MIKNPLYVYGPRTMQIPADLNFGGYILDKIWEHGDKVALLNSAHDIEQLSPRNIQHGMDIPINGATQEEYKYSAMAQHIMNVAISLSHIGVRKGEVVAVCSENRKEYWAAVFGAACVGALVTTVNPMYTESELKHVLSITNPKYMFCSPTFYKTRAKFLKTLTHLKKIILFGDKTYHSVIYYDDIAISVDGTDKDVHFRGGKLNRNVKYEEFQAMDVDGGNDVVFVLYSSGTTGLPKGVMLTHVNVLAACVMPSASDPKNTGVTIAPWFHTMGLVGTAFALCYGRRMVFLPKFDVDQLMKCIEVYEIPQLTVVPPVLVAICKSQATYDLSSVKMVYTGAAPLQEDTIKIVKTRFPKVEAVLQGYGMTEATLAVIRGTYDQEGPNKPGSIGTVTPGTIAKVVDVETGKAVGPNQRGELCFKSPQIMKGYVGKNNKEFFDDEGFYKTGDVGYYDDDRHFFIVDRLKELIKYKGFQVAPAEIEALLLQHGGVQDAGVVGLPDSTAGELPLAFVVKQPGSDVTEKEIQDYVAEKLSNPKQLRGGVHFVSEIPKNQSGKILRKTLRTMIKKTKAKL